MEMDSPHCTTESVDPEWFFDVEPDEFAQLYPSGHPEGHTARSLNNERRLRAKLVCAGCPLRRDCLQEALQDSELVGVWGGYDDRERVAIRRGAVTPFLARRVERTRGPAQRPEVFAALERFRQGESLRSVMADLGVSQHSLAKAYDRIVS